MKLECMELVDTSIYTYGFLWPATDVSYNAYSNPVATASLITFEGTLALLWPEGVLYSMVAA